MGSRDSRGESEGSRDNVGRVRTSVPFGGGSGGSRNVGPGISGVCAPGRGGSEGF